MKLNDIDKQMENLIDNVDENFERILELNKPIIYKVIKNLKFKKPIEFEDLYQEASIVLYKTAKKYKFEKISFTTFLYNSLKNNLIQYIRKNQYVVVMPSTKSFKDIENVPNFYKMNNITIEDLENIEIKNDIDIIDALDLKIKIEKIKSKLTKDEIEMMEIINETNLTEYGKRKNISRERARQKWNKLKDKIRNMKDL